MKNGKPKVAIVHDWLVAYAGADRVVDCMHHVFPDAPIYTLVYDENNMPAWFKDYDIRTTYLQKLPFATKLYRAMLPWMPRAFEALDLSEYDMVISSCSSCSKGVITRPDAVHICYCHTPTRYVWDFYYTYRNNANALVRAVMPGQMLKLRQWDKCAADRVDYFIANSHYIARRWLDRLDVLQWTATADELFGRNNETVTAGDSTRMRSSGTEMVVHGISMGAATTMMVSGEVEHGIHQQPFIKCFVEDCGYTSVQVL